MESLEIKPSKSVAEQISLLRDKNMMVDEAEAHQWLQNVGYYRLSGYWYPCRTLEDATTKPPRRSDDFTDGTRFSDVVHLYEADRKMRSLIHDGLERVEIGMRALVGNLLAARDPLCYFDPNSFRPTFDHIDWVGTAANRIKRARGRSESIKHYENKYCGKYPIWVLMEVLDMSDVSKLYSGLTWNDQKTIAESLGLTVVLDSLTPAQKKKISKRHPLGAWMEQLVILRNAAAHHGRMWNDHYSPAGATTIRHVEGLESLPEGQSERIYGGLVMISHLLKTLSPGSSWTAKVRTLLLEEFEPNPIVEMSSMGCPDGWISQAPWNSSTSVAPAGGLI